MLLAETLQDRIPTADFNHGLELGDQAAQVDRCCPFPAYPAGSNIANIASREDLGFRPGLDRKSVV